MAMDAKTMYGFGSSPVLGSLIFILLLIWLTSMLLVFRFIGLAFLTVMPKILYVLARGLIKTGNVIITSQGKDTHGTSLNIYRNQSEKKNVERSKVNDHLEPLQ